MIRLSHWHCGAVRFDLAAKPLVMGIINVTPDSFSDGGEYLPVARAVERGRLHAVEGAEILDVGGESTRPGATPVSEAEELNRILPVIRALKTVTKVAISIDTMKAAVAHAAVEAGASIINDVSGFRDPAMIDVAARTGAGVVVMHMPGLPTTMNDNPQYTDVVREVVEYLRVQTDKLLAAGVKAEAISVDPGIGFGKLSQHSLSLLAHLDEFAALGYPLCLGVSRKGFLGRVTGRETGDRMPASLAVACRAVVEGTAQVLRVHDVGPTVDMVKVMQAISAARTGTAR